MLHYQSQKINYVFLFPGLLLFFFILAFPTSLYNIKIALLVCVFFEILIWTLIRKTILIKRKWILFVLFVEIASSLFIALGVFLNAPGAINSATVFIAWPIVYLVLFSMLFFDQVLFSLFKVFILSLLFISIYSFTYIGNELGVIPKFLYIDFDLGQSIGFYNGFMEYSLYSLNSLIFLIPFCISGVLVWNQRFYNTIRVSKNVVLIITILGLISALLSGRRGLWLSIVIGTLISFILYLMIMKHNKSFLKKVSKYAVIILLLGLVIIPIFNMYIDININSLWDKFNLDMGYERESQLESLINGWMNRPIFGNGLGSVASVIRSEEMPWAYELQYVDLLFKTGIIGVLIYTLSGFYIINKLVKIARRDDESAMVVIPILTGLSAFLIANATNPYLLKFDYVWLLLLPIGIINHYSLTQNELYHNGNGGEIDV